jgi:hypothetical protein
MAAILAKLSGGQYYDNQSGMTCEAAEALTAAGKEIKIYVDAAGPRDFAKHPFPGWDQLA